MGLLCAERQCLQSSTVRPVAGLGGAEKNRGTQSGEEWNAMAEGLLPFGWLYGNAEPSDGVRTLQ